MVEIELDGRPVRLTNLDKVVWPRTRTTKRDLVEYYVEVADIILPHIARRPLTLGRYPEGVEGVNWFQTTCPHPPPWMKTHPVARRGGLGLARDYCVVVDLPGLLWAVNLGSIELHPLLASIDRPSEPTVVAFDLDPGPRTSIEDCCRVALELRALLDSVGLAAFCKTSGSVGLHVYVPLNRAARYPATKGFARSIALHLAGEHPDRVTWRKDLRHRSGKVLIDWSQNDEARSMIAPYSLRAMPWPAASTPLSWAEVERGVEGGSSALPLSAADVLERVRSRGDIFAQVLTLAQELPPM